MTQAVVAIEDVVTMRDKGVVEARTMSGMNFGCTAQRPFPYSRLWRFRIDGGLAN